MFEKFAKNIIQIQICRCFKQKAPRNSQRLFVDSIDFRGFKVKSIEPLEKPLEKNPAFGGRQLGCLPWAMTLSSEGEGFFFRGIFVGFVLFFSLNEISGF